MVKKKKWVALVVAGGIILTILWAVLISGFFSFHKHFSYKKEDYVPNDKWHITSENYEEYCPKYINYYEYLFSDIKNECEVTKTVNQYVVDNNEYESYIFDVNFYSGENLYVEVYSEL